MQIPFDPTNVADVKAVVEILAMAPADASAPPPPAPPPPPPPAPAASESASKDFVVFDPNGEKRAGYAHSKDAATVITQVAEAVASMSEMDAFVNANLKTIAGLAKADKNRVNQAVAGRALAIQKAEKEDADKPIAQSPVSAEAALAAAFGPPTPAPEAPEAALSKEEFSKKMLALGEKMGPQGMSKFGDTVRKKYGSILHVPESDFVLLISAAEEFLRELQK